MQAPADWMPVYSLFASETAQKPLAWSPMCAGIASCKDIAERNDWQVYVIRRSFWTPRGDALRGMVVHTQR